MPGVCWLAGVRLAPAALPLPLIGGCIVYGIGLELAKRLFYRFLAR